MTGRLRTAQLAGNGKEAFVDDAVALECVGRFQYVVDAGTITTVGGTHDVQQLLFRQASHIARGVAVHGKGKGSNVAVFGTAVQPARYVCSAGHLPAPQSIHDLGRVRLIDTKNHAAAGAAGIERKYEPGALRRATVHAGPQAQGTMIPMQQGMPALHELKFRPPDERTVA